MAVTSEDAMREIRSGKGSPRAGSAEQLTRADRVARGKDARALAPDAGPERHLPRLDPRAGPRWGEPRLVRASAKGLEVLRPIELMIPSGMTVYARLCGWTLARAHARSGDRIALAAYLGGSARFDQAIAEFAETYAGQNERDYAALQAAVKDGRAEAAAEI